MARNFILGSSFGRLTPLREVAAVGGNRKWICRCQCGREAVVFQGNLVRGHTTSCGCTKSSATHGKSGVPEYRHWINMISRCENPKTPGYENYGGRGISVCSRWRQSFVDFLTDVSPRPSPKHSLDRIDVNGNYEPGNVRWATQMTQCRNTRTNRIVTVDGQQITLAEAVERRGLKYNTVLYRLLRGKTVDEALR